MRIDYKEKFEQEYQTKIKSGKQGWNNPKIAKSQLNIVETILKRNILLPTNILDLGCGDGGLTILLAKKYTVSGIDISPTAIKWAEQKSKDVNVSIDFKIGNVTNLPFKDNQFDLVIDSFCLHCIIGEDRAKFFYEAKRVLNETGILLLMTKTGNPKFGKNSQRRFDPKSRIVYLNNRPDRYWGLVHDIIKEIKDSGLNVKHHEIKHYDDKPNTGLLIITAYKKP